MTEEQNTLQKAMTTVSLNQELLEVLTGNAVLTNAVF